MMLLFTLLIFLRSFSLGASENFPVVYEGRIHSAYAYQTLTGHLLENSNLLVLPSKYSEDWVPLSRLRENANNFTPYSNEFFHEMRTAYKSDQHTRLATLLENAYAISLAGKTHKDTYEKALTYPSLWQLKAETLYYKIPLSIIIFAAYALATIGLMLKKPFWHIFGWVSFICAFLMHSFFLLLRCYILDRPPVSNMFESIAFVPWVTVLISFAVYYFTKQKIVLTCASFVAFALFSLLLVTGLGHSLDNVQPVLDSRYWLIIHVLMVVSSYGVFALSAILAHLFLYSKNKPALLIRTILHTMYLGTFLLICGTILGGVWAAESWGRFWDWDPKESWAFISICLYLIWIHAYQFKYIGDTFLALGSALSFLSITFTWYGVNYVLGTGLHSYGFGNGGEWIYYTFLAVDLITLGFLTYRSKNLRLMKEM